MPNKDPKMVDALIGNLFDKDGSKTERLYEHLRKDYLYNKSRTKTGGPFLSPL